MVAEFASFAVVFLFIPFVNHDPCTGLPIA